MFNPLFDAFDTPVLGPALLNTVIPAYLMPTAILVFGARWLRGHPSAQRDGFVAVGLGLAILWLGLTIRHFWRGAEGMVLPAIGPAERYSYTVALLIVGAGLFYQSLTRPGAMLRKAGLLVIGLAVAKVFVLDISGLGGLIRVF